MTLATLSCPAAPTRRAEAMDGAFRSFVLGKQSTCVGARSAINNHGYRLGAYAGLASPAATAALARDLAAFVREYPAIDAPLATYAAIFEALPGRDELAFERALWAQLQALHDLDRSAWDPAVSADPRDPRFSFSFAGMAFFVVGLHPGSARLSRRFPWPALIFNPHAQFEQLRASGRYERMQKVIRDKECALQGDINPALAEHGHDSEARQYSGRNVEADWTPPFHPRLTQLHGAPRLTQLHGAPRLTELHGAPRLTQLHGAPRLTQLHGAPRLTDERPTPGIRYRIPAHSGVAFRVARGQRLRIVDPQGLQVCDLYSVVDGEPREHLSSGRSIDYADTLYLTTGHVLYSNRERAMWTIGRDDVGRHDLVLTPCSPEMYRRLRGDDGTHPSCYENLRIPMAAFGVESDSIGSTFNIFMDVRFDQATGKMTIAPPASAAGDAIELTAELDMIVGLTACSSEVSNAGSLKPIDFEVLVD